MSIKAWIQDWSLGHAVRRQTVLKGTRLVAEGRFVSWCNFGRGRFACWRKREPWGLDGLIKTGGE